MNIREQKLHGLIQLALDQFEEADIEKISMAFPEFSPDKIAQVVRNFPQPLLQLVNSKGEITTKVQTYKKVHSSKTLHKAVQVIVLTADDMLVLRLRTDNHKWDISASGHVLVGEDTIVAAKRVLRDKLQLDIGIGRFTKILPPRALKRSFTKWGRADNKYEPCYSKDDGVFRYRGRDAENFEINDLFVVRATPLDRRTGLDSFVPTNKVKAIRYVWAEELLGDIDGNADSFASGARQYFQDHGYRSLIIDQVWKSSRPVFAFDYDATLEKKGWPLRKSMAQLLARLIVEEGGRIAVMSAKAMGEEGYMRDALAEFEREKNTDEAKAVETALNKRYGIMEFAAQSILDAADELIGINLGPRDTANWLILFPAKSNAKYKCVARSFVRIEEKTISPQDVTTVINVLNTSFGSVGHCSSGVSWHVLDQRLTDPLDRTSNVPHLVLFSSERGVTKILLRPFPRSAKTINDEARTQFVVALRDQLDVVGLPHLAVDKGGDSAVDITAVDKAYGIDNLYGIDGHTQVYYFGDEPLGSDRSIFEGRDRWPTLKLFDVSFGNEDETEEIVRNFLYS